MNNFTKEELVNIVKCIYYTYTHEQVSPEIHLFLREKIQSMIDNYREPLPTCAEDKHDWEFVDHGSAGYYKCLVCQRSYNEQTRLAEL